MTERSVIAYWGPGLSGKSTNLDVVREVLAGSAKERRETAQLVEVGPDRVLIDLYVEGAQLELLAPPGQVHHRQLRQEAFSDVDGVVFVADSSAGAVEVNLAALEELELFVASRHQELGELALVFQFNKRDLCDALEVSRLEELLNPTGRPSVEAIATRGVGVFPALKAVARELQSSRRAARSGSLARHPSAALQEGVVLSVGDALGGDEGAPESPAPGVRSMRLGEKGSLLGTEPVLGVWPLLLAGMLGVLAREVLEFGWGLATGGG